MLFNIFFGAIIEAARIRFSEQSLGVKMSTRLHGKLLRRRGTARLSVEQTQRPIYDIDFADDCVICAMSQEDLQAMVDILDEIITAFGLARNISVKDKGHGSAG
jgi:hypothetical protein